MPNETEIDLMFLKSLPARELIKLPYEELDQLIVQARRIRDDASLIADWLAGIRLEKSVRETAEERGDPK